MGNTKSQPTECLFCGNEGKSFENIEHIIPESLGNKALVLAGVVCDKCNSYFSELENYFAHHHLSSAVRLLSVPETKKGKPPMQALESGDARRQDDGKITFKQPFFPGTESEQFSITFFAEDVIIKGNYLLPDADAKKLSRLLAKCGLETLYLKKGDIAYSPAFDPIRRYARYGDTVPFVPFLWHYQNEKNAELLLAEMTHRSQGVFFFATIFVPGCVYFVPLSRFEETLAFNKLAELYSLNKVSEPGLLKREPIKFEARLSQQKQTE